MTSRTRLGSDGRCYTIVDDDDVVSQSTFVEPPTVLSSTTPEVRVLSNESGYAPFETIFNDLNLHAEPTYNFWVQGDETDDQERGTQKLEELPRYVHLSWMQAPDLKDPNERSKNKLQSSGPDARELFAKLPPFGFGSRMVVGSNTSGVTWTPPSLQPESFEQNVARAVNGFIAPGVIEAIVSVPPDSVTAPPNPSSLLVDEDDFLAHSDMFEGITYSEFNAAAWSWANRTSGKQSGMNGMLSPTAELMKRTFFRNRFAISPMSNNIIDMKSIGLSGPTISVNATTATSATPQALPVSQQMADAMSTEDRSLSPSSSPSDHSVKVKFINTNMNGAIETQRVMSAKAPEHAESIIAISQIAGNLAVYAASGFQQQQRSADIPSLPAPTGLKPFEYIGYVIEKFEQVNGSFKSIEMIHIPGREYDEYFDTKVKYGKQYRYRIKSVLRWIRPSAKGVFGYDITSVKSKLVDIDSISPNKASFFNSEWSKDWASAFVIDTTPPAPPDEFTVRPHSAEGVIEVTMKVPYNPQRDISKMTIWRKVQDEWGNDLSKWVQLVEYVGTSDADRQGNKATFMSTYKHKQDDMTGTKSTSTQNVGNIVVEFAPVNARFVDTFYGSPQYFGDNSRYNFVYAATCHTKHGEISKLSDQISARLNYHWKKDGEYPVKFVSCAGVDKDFDEGSFSVYPTRHSRSEITLPAIVKSRVAFSGQARLAKKPVHDNEYVVRIESLDMGAHIDLPVHISVVNTPRITTTESMPVIVLNDVS